MLLLSFTKYTLSVSLGKCSTIVSNRFTRLSFNIVRCSNSRLPSALWSTDVGSYIVCLTYVILPSSVSKSVLPQCSIYLYSKNLDKVGVVGNKDIVRPYRLLHHEYPSCLLEVPPVLSNTMWVKRKLVQKELDKAFDQTNYMMENTMFCQ